VVVTESELLTLFLEKVSAEYPKHMFCEFAAAAAHGVIRPFLQGLLKAIAAVEKDCPGYAEEMLGRIGSVRDTGIKKYESLIQILAEVYVAGGAIRAADRVCGVASFAHEPGQKGAKNPELEVSIGGHWVAIEVKAPALVDHLNRRGTQFWQLAGRLPPGATPSGPATLPRDNPVKDFLVSANEKFQAYEAHRAGAVRLLFIVWDDFANEPVTALISEGSGLLTPASFHKDASGAAVTYPNVDAVVILRQQHQFMRATRLGPLVDGVLDAMEYRHQGFPPKVLIQVPGGRPVPAEVVAALGLTVSPCMGAEYKAGEIIMWVPLPK
jgi:hypothetical protein